jgi:hypothetical protein
MRNSSDCTSFRLHTPTALPLRLLLLDLPFVRTALLKISRLLPFVVSALQELRVAHGIVLLPLV